MEPFLYFYEFANRISQSHEKCLEWRGKKNMQVINCPLVSNPWTSSRNKKKFNGEAIKKMEPFLYFYEFPVRNPQTHEKGLQ